MLHAASAAVMAVGAALLIVVRRRSARVVVKVRAAHSSEAGEAPLLLALNTLDAKGIRVEAPLAGALACGVHHQIT